MNMMALRTITQRSASLPLRRCFQTAAAAVPRRVPEFAFAFE